MLGVQNMLGGARMKLGVNTMLLWLKNTSTFINRLAR